MKMKIWWGINWFWIVVCLINAGVIIFRHVDATGVVQTTSIKIATLGMLGLFFLFIAVCQFIAYLFVRWSIKNAQ